MFIYGKMVANAIAVMSYLSADPERRVDSREISSKRKISRALTAKLLTQLAAAGFVKGQPGPGGGYMLAKPAAQISLMDIASLFEQTDSQSVCPLGHTWCTKEKPCPFHDSFQRVYDENRRFMEQTNLEIFVHLPHDCQAG